MNAFAHFDIVRGVAIDVMHGVYGGVMKMLISLWFNTKGSWYIGTRIHEVDAQLVSISPPMEISKDIRSLKERNYWKGNFLFHF